MTRSLNSPINEGEFSDRVRTTKTTIYDYATI